MISNCVNGQKQVCDPFLGSSPEVCNGLDDDCDGPEDEGLGTTTCGFGPCAKTVQNCEQGTPQTCDPFDVAVPEVCGDVTDQDCDGGLNNGCPQVFHDCNNDPTVFVGQSHGCFFGQQRYVNRISMSVGCTSEEQGVYLVEFSDGSELTFDAACGTELEIAPRVTNGMTWTMLSGGGADQTVTWHEWGMYYK